MVGDAYPLLRDYLAKLPAGLESYPECQARASMLRMELATNPPGNIPPAGLPEQLLETLRSPPMPSGWMPEVHSVAAHLVLFQRTYGGDLERARAGGYEMNKRLFRSTMYRVLTTFATPGLLVRGGPREWDKMRKGTSLRADATRRGATVVLDFPPHLLPPFLVEVVCAGFDAVVHAAGAHDARFEITAYAPTRATLQASW